MKKSQFMIFGMTRDFGIAKSRYVRPSRPITGGGISGMPFIKKNMRIRKLTPLECWRLMGFDDQDYYKAEKVNTQSQLYKQAGNSIVVDVLMAIFKEMLPKDAEL